MQPMFLRWKGLRSNVIFVRMTYRLFSISSGGSCQVYMNIHIMFQLIMSSFRKIM